MKSHSSQIQFGSQLVSPWSATPYSDAINRGGSTSEGTASGRKARIKRPMNGFMVWSQTKRRQLSAENPGLHNAEISRRLGQLWLQMPEEDRLPFMEEAERLRVLHSRQYPGYQYRPRKRKALTEGTLETVEEKRRTVEPLPPKIPGSGSGEAALQRQQGLYERGSRSVPQTTRLDDPSHRRQDPERSLRCSVESMDGQPWKVENQLGESWNEYSPTLGRDDIGRSGPSYPLPESQTLLQSDWDNKPKLGRQSTAFQASSSRRYTALGDLPSPVEAKPWPRNLCLDYHMSAWKGSSGEVNHQPIPPETTNDTWSGEEGIGVKKFDLSPDGSITQYPAFSDFTSGGGSPYCACMMPTCSVSTTSGSLSEQHLQPPLNISHASSHWWTRPASHAPDTRSVSSSTGSHQDCWDHFGAAGTSHSDYWGNAADDGSFGFTSAIGLPEEWNSNDDLPAGSAAFPNYATTPDPFVSWLINFYDVELTNPCSAQ